jgi:sporulation protein YlmC with PRC-barrel domain
MDPAARSALMRLSELRDAKLKTLDGETLGRVHEVHVEAGKVVALICGPGSLVERLTARKHGRRIAWQCVRRVTRNEIVVAPDPPSRVSASRSRPGTRRPSGQRSKR